MFFPKELNHTNESSRTGVVRCAPGALSKFTLCESIEIGRTNLSYSGAVKAALRLAKEWPASSYHLTRHNCISFSEALVERFGLEPAFPEWVTSSCKMAVETPSIAAFFDNSMEYMKWQCASPTDSSTDCDDVCF